MNVLVNRNRVSKDIGPNAKGIDDDCFSILSRAIMSLNNNGPYTQAYTKLFGITFIIVHFNMYTTNTTFVYGV